VPRFDTDPAELWQVPDLTDANLDLRPLVDGARVKGIALDESLLDWGLRLTVEGATQLVVTIFDPGWELLTSGLFDVDDDGRFSQPLEVKFDTEEPLWFRAVAVEPDDSSLTLTFEDREIALLREADRRLVARSSEVTFPQFAARLIRSVPDGRGRLRAWVPEVQEEQAVQAAEVTRGKAPRRSRDAQRAKGLPDGMTLKVPSGSHTLTQQETQNAETVLEVADEEDAGPKATLALVMACIVEAPFFANPTTGDDTSVGTLQMRDGHLGGSASTNGGRRDVPLICRIFLRNGFAKHVPKGAMELARANPGWSAGEVAQACQGSGYPDRYDEVRGAALKVIAAWDGGGGRTDRTRDTPTSRQVRKPHLYKVTGDYWQTLTGYAEELAWRTFAVNGVIFVVSEERLFRSRSRMTLDRRDGWGIRFKWDVRRRVKEVEVTGPLEEWQAPHGSVVTVESAGPADGDWIVKTLGLGKGDPDVTATLVKPTLKKAEQADQITTVTTRRERGGDEETSVKGSGVNAALRWARATVGRFEEPRQDNRGPELDRLQRQFNLIGEPWCAMWATEAVSKGAGNEVETASVAEIRQWAEAGTHGYERGMRPGSQAQPGDLFCIGTAHVAFVERRSGSMVKTIEGNTGSGRVSRGDRPAGGGQIARPRYRE